MELRSISSCSAHNHSSFHRFSLQLYGFMVNGARTGNVYSVTYTTGSAQAISQSQSDWTASQSYPNEYVAKGPLTSDTATGGHGGNVYVYE